MLEHLEERTKHYITDDIFMLFGGDFTYINAFHYYKNMDSMIEYMNKYHGDKYHFRYLILSDYVDAVAAYNIFWLMKIDDMFPYSDYFDVYWIGYFSSRANDKEYIRRASHNFHAAN